MAIGVALPKRPNREGPCLVSFTESVVCLCLTATGELTRIKGRGGRRLGPDVEFVKPLATLKSAKEEDGAEE